MLSNYKVWGFCGNFPVVAIVIGNYLGVSSSWCSSSNPHHKTNHVECFSNATVYNKYKNSLKPENIELG